MKGPGGTDHGKVLLSSTPAGVLLTASLKNLPAGTHSMHIHEVGDCSRGSKSAGGHFAPSGGAHGFLMPEGPHAGDLPNIHLPETGVLIVQILNAWVSLQAGAEHTLLDGDGASILIHAYPDDYSTQPAGGDGDLLACGTIE